jgi:hypothetical protein
METHLPISSSIEGALVEKKKFLKKMMERRY